MAILEELKAKANGKADAANNIQEAVSMMEFGGGSGGAMVVGGVTLFSGLPVGTLDKTWQEIYNALAAGGSVALVIEDSSVPTVVRQIITAAYVNNGKYMVNIGDTTLETDSASGYPSTGGVG